MIPEQSGQLLSERPGYSFPVGGRGQRFREQPRCRPEDLPDQRPHRQLRISGYQPSAGRNTIQWVAVEVIGILDAVGAEMSATEIGPGDEVGVADADEIEVTGLSLPCFRYPNSPWEPAVKSDVGTLFVDGTQADVASVPR